MSNVREKEMTIDFGKAKGRDNKMYNLTEGYNLESRNETMIDKIIEINKGKNYRRLSHMITEALGGKSIYGQSRTDAIDNLTESDERTIE